MSLKTILSYTLVAAAQLASAHSVITGAVGNAGGSGMALGVDTTTPRDGTRRRPFQQDATRFRGDAADSVGETLAGGDNDVETGTQAIMAETGEDLPQVTPGGEVQMTLHQVNSDGAGPYTCMINDDGTGQTWTPIQVTQNVEGSERGRNEDGEATDFPLTAAIPANQECTGQVAGQENGTGDANNTGNQGTGDANNTGNQGTGDATNTGNQETGDANNTGNQGTGSSPKRRHQESRGSIAALMLGSLGTGILRIYEGI
ncbi:hypothetical protein ACJZ2D_009474 [Fusarium nematophilum]